MKHHFSFRAVILLVYLGGLFYLRVIIFFFFFFFVSSETKRDYFGFDMNYLHIVGYYAMKRALVTTMSTRFTTGKQSRKNIMFFKYRKDNRQQDQK